jgi:HAMP domain-containing protein
VITAAAFWKAGARAMRDQGRFAARVNAQIAAERLDEIQRLEAEIAELKKKSGAEALRT